MKSQTYYYGLDLLRFVSALMVALFHLFFWSWAGIFTTIDQTNHVFADAARFPSAVGLTWFGWVGVQVFFVISGFVISNSAVSASPMEFLTSRILRLYPAAWICATGTLAVLYFIAGDPLSVLVGPYVKSLLLIPRSRWIDGAYWTLAVEIAFYASVFLVLLLKRVSFIHLAWALTFCSGIFNAFYLGVAFGLVPLSDFIEFWTRILLTPGLALLPYGCVFALGIWLWLAANDRMTSARWIGLMVALVASGIEVYAQAVQTVSFVPAATGQSPLLPLAIFLVTTFLVAVFTQTDKFYLPPGRARTSLRYIGLMTYPFYLIHNLVGAGISRLLIEAGLHGLLAVSLTLGGLLCLCWFFCWGIEPVIRHLLRAGLVHFERAILRPRRVLAFLFVK